MSEIILGILMVFGAFFILVAAIGLLRFNDLYSRMHAATKATSFGILLIITGVSIFFASEIVWLKSILIVLFIYLTAPLAAHAVARSFRNGQKDKP